MVLLENFTESDFDQLIAWVDTKELLVTIAGTDLMFPLTSAQLLAYLNQENSHSFTMVDGSTKRRIGHAEILVKDEGLCKIDKLLVGDKSIRGRGIGRAAVNALVDYSFESLGADVVELNVFDWNVAGIKCYENCGFSPTPNSSLVFEVDGNRWTAFNMRIYKERWIEVRRARENKEKSAS